MAANEELIGRIRRFNRFYTTFLGVLDRHFLESSYSLTEVRVLYEICHGWESCARDIGVSLGVDRGYLSRIMDSFITRGLVRKSPSPQDRRRHIIALTQKGKEVFGELEARSEKSVARTIEALSHEQRDELARHMERIEELLSRGAEE